MRFMLLIKGQESEHPAAPPAELMTAVSEYMQEVSSSGILVDTGGLAPSTQDATRIRVADGRLTVADGPFAGSGEALVSRAGSTCAPADAQAGTSLRCRQCPSTDKYEGMPPPCDAPTWTPAAAHNSRRTTLVGGRAQVDVDSAEDAVALATRFMELHQKHWPGWAGEGEVRRVLGPEG